MNTKQALIKTNSKNFFKHWLILTRPLHKLKSQEINVLALLLYNYFELKKQITNDDLSWKLTFDYDTKLKIRRELNIMQASFNNVIYSLRKKKIITEGKINKSFVPILNLESSNTYSLIFKFEIVND